jgi:prepilin signal peptidase PulO-like enzyme (type II secretory pathway)
VLLRSFPLRARAAGVLLGAAAVAASAALVSLQPAWLAASCALGWCLLALAWIDLREQRLPDLLTLPLVLAGLGEALLLEPESALDRAIGAIAGYLAFRLLALGYAALRGRAGLGEGDAKLLAAAGAWLGWAVLPALVLIASVLALVFVLVLFVAAANPSPRAPPARRGRASAVPEHPSLAGAGWGRGTFKRSRLDPGLRISFGPFLAAATWLLWLRLSAG